MEIRAETASELYLRTLGLLMIHGRETAPRGMSTTEIIGAHLVLTNPHHNIIAIPKRKLSYHFMVAEWLWMMEGANRVDLIRPYNERIATFSDDGNYLLGAYGPKLVEQLPYVIKTLTADPASRQAVLTLWRERPGQSKDIPCTIMFQFLMREPAPGVKVLDMLTYMRSNDAWWGLPYDLFTFTMIQQHVAGQLWAMCGTYHHMVGSLHVYEEFVPKARILVDDGDQGISPYRDYVTDHMMPLEPISPELRSAFVGLSLMAKHAETAEDIKTWCNELVPESPWREMLSLLGHRFHKDNDMLLSPWKELVVNDG